MQRHQHIDNHMEEEIKEIHDAVKANSKACLPRCQVLDPICVFRGEDDTTELTALLSSAGLSIWKEGDPVHLTETYYGDIFWVWFWERWRRWRRQQENEWKAS